MVEGAWVYLLLAFAIIWACTISVWFNCAIKKDMERIINRMNFSRYNTRSIQITPEQIKEITSLEAEVFNKEVFIIIHPDNQICLGENEVPHPQDD